MLTCFFLLSAACKILTYVINLSLQILCTWPENPSDTDTWMWIFTCLIPLYWYTSSLGSILYSDSLHRHEKKKPINIPVTLCRWSSHSFTEPHCPFLCQCRLWPPNFACISTTEIPFHKRKLPPPIGHVTDFKYLVNSTYIFCLHFQHRFKHAVLEYNQMALSGCQSACKVEMILIQI